MSLAKQNYRLHIQTTQLFALSSPAHVHKGGISTTRCEIAISSVTVISPVDGVITFFNNWNPCSFEIDIKNLEFIFSYQNMFQFELPIGGRSDDLAKKVHGSRIFFLVLSNHIRENQFTYSTVLKKSLVRICSGCESLNITINLAKTASSSGTRFC